MNTTLLCTGATLPPQLLTDSSSPFHAAGNTAAVGMTCHPLTDTGPFGHVQLGQLELFSVFILFWESSALSSIKAAPEINLFLEDMDLIKSIKTLFVGSGI